MLNIPAPDMNPDWQHEAVYDASALAEAKTADEIWQSLHRWLMDTKHGLRPRLILETRFTKS